jgi:hypothetical protein
MEFHFIILIVALLVLIALIICIYYKNKDFISILFPLCKSESESKSGGSATEKSEKLIWPTKHVFTESQIQDALDFINFNNFGAISQSEFAKLKKYSADHKIPIEQMISFRNMLITEKSIQSSKEIYKYRQQLKNDAKSTNADEFFKKYPLDPIQIIKELGRDNVSEEILKYADNFSKENKEKFSAIQKKARSYEIFIEDWVKKSAPNIKFQTEETLRSEQIEKHGRVIATPDILFDEPVILKTKDSEHLIRWIDAKDYCLVDIPFIMKKLVEQAETYTTLYGPGAFCFHYGITQGIEIPNTILLS